MPSNRDNIQILVELLKKHDISRLVINPGGTNIAFVRAVQDDPFFTCYSVVDERSAVYFAIGLYLQTGKTIALCCTSAQATRNYIPGLTEAFYKRVPLLAITMMKHPRFTYQEYMQAPDQSSLPADSVKKSFVLPYISDVNDVFHAIRVANQAILELSRNGMGPVQLCVPWLDYSIEGARPLVRSMHRYSIGDDWNVSLSGKKVMLVIGEHRPFAEEDRELINEFSDKFDAVIYTNHLSNFSSDRCVSSNLLLSVIEKEKFKDLAPDVLISIGGQTGDYPFYRMLSRPEFEGIEHWRVAPDGNVVDTYDKLVNVFQCDDWYFFKHFVSDSDYSSGKGGASYLDGWLAAEANLNRAVSVPFSNVSIAQYLSPLIPGGSVVQFSILNSLRVWDLFELDESVSCFSNVGAFGIDGGMSTLIGQSFATDALCFMVVGDLAFLYDINSLSIRGIRSNVRILLINNGGGFEFKLGTGHDKETDRYIAAAGHFKTARGWAEDCGFEYLSAKSEEEFEAFAKRFVGESDYPIILEAFVTDDNEALAYEKILRENQDLKPSDVIIKGVKRSIKRTVGAEGARKLSSFLNRKA